MIRKPVKLLEGVKGANHYPFIFALGLMVGVITGTVGAGGGFLIIPALVFMAGLSMKKAVGTSLLIIAINSLIGFAGDLSAGIKMDYRFILMFTSLAIVGILLGAYLTRYISNAKLKPAFGWFVLALGMYILTSELIF
jgi:uncharacterized protein